ncbi:MAG: DedA family protein [Alphaproteobacteria bacterium]|nr:DedA family protein [Alphaproteobacteria bacterium]
MTVSTDPADPAPADPAPRRTLRSRLMDVARGPHAEKTMWAVSFTESSFFPLPPDLLLGPMAALQPQRWLRYSIGCTIASVLGGLLGYAIGMYLFELVGQAILTFFGYAGEREAALREEYAKWGAWVILIKGLTPIPYKLVTILSGAMAFSLPIFIVTSAITRGARFLIVAWIFQKFGPGVAPVIEKRLGIVLLAVAIAIVAIVVALRYLH